MKDPAALLYIDTWLSSTAEMDADCRGWYLNLLLHQYDKKSLPNDIEKLAVLAGVKFSEFERFKQVFEQVLKQKFEQTENGRLENLKASEIIRKREKFQDKRSRSGKIGQIVKTAMKISGYENYIDNLKNDLYEKSIDDLNNLPKDKQMLKQVLKQMLTLYINEDGDVNKNINTKDKLNLFVRFWDQYGKKVGDKNKCEKKFLKLNDSEIDKIFDTLEAFKSQFTDKQYQPFPMTYLNQCRWNDEIKPIEENEDKSMYSLYWFKEAIRRDIESNKGINVERLKKECYERNGYEL